MRSAVNQSTLIALAIVAAFFIYIAAKGKLRSYMSVLGITKGGDQPADSGGSSGDGGSSGGLPSVLPPFLTPGDPSSIIPSPPKLSPIPIPNIFPWGGSAAGRP